MRRLEAAAAIDCAAGVFDDDRVEAEMPRILGRPAHAEIERQTGNEDPLDIALAKISETDSLRPPQRDTFALPFKSGHLGNVSLRGRNSVIRVDVGGQDLLDRDRADAEILQRQFLALDHIVSFHQLYLIAGQWRVGKESH